MYKDMINNDRNFFEVQSLFITSVSIYPILLLVLNTQGRGTQGGGRSDPSRIRDLCSKNFENSQIQLFFSIGPPLGKNCSLAPVNTYSRWSGAKSNYLDILQPLQIELHLFTLVLFFRFSEV